MSEMNEKQLEYDNDSRVACKYGAKCFQKNPNHHQKYKHHPNRKVEKNYEHVRKKFKADTNEDTYERITLSDTSDDSSNSNDQQLGECSTQIKITNDVSDSETSESDTDKSEHKKIKSKDDKVSSFCVNVTPSDESKNDKNSNFNKLEDNIDMFKAIDDSYMDELCVYKDFIKEKFLVDMPSNFFHFWSLCKKISSTPQAALKDIGLSLVGPFDVLAGKFKDAEKSCNEYLIHWRYFRDPPEFQTVLKGDDKLGYHIGYFRDSPGELPILLCSNKSKQDGILTVMGGNLFAAVNFYLEDLKKTGDPFKKIHIPKIQTALKREAEIHQLDMSRKTNQIVEREKKIVTRSLNKIGLVVPYNKKTQVGYRELALNSKDLNIVLTKLQNAKSEEEKQKAFSELQPVITYTNIAIDECDFGTGIELGWNFIAHGIESLNSTIEDFLVKSYKLLNNDEFAQIAKAHMQNRKKGCNLSVL